ncbi:MAG: DUF2148 domain-containing protein [Oscillospiraceae bacterium]|nr:DUF2148 domain-containing protein [Oscillospiraceae bacterium]
MICTSDNAEKRAIMISADLMSAAARTAPKACGVDLIETLILDGEEKAGLTAAMRELGAGKDKFFIRDAGNVDSSGCILLIGAGVAPRGLNCGLCGAETCASAGKNKISCALAVNDLGIAVGSAAATAMDRRIDNRVLFTAGMAALKLKLFSDNVKICFGIALSVSGKNIFFDRPNL